MNWKNGVGLENNQ